VNSSLTYRASFYVMMTVATTILCGDAADSRLDWFLPVGVAAAGALAFFTVDQTARWGLPRDVANILAVGTLGLLFLEYRSDEAQTIRCLGHWMIYLQLIKYFLPKTAEDDWFLFLLGLTQVLIGSVINPGDMVGAWLFFWAMLAVWVLGLFFLQREIHRVRTETEAVAVGSKPPAHDPYRGLFDLPYFGATLQAMAMTLVLGGLVFLLLPRQAGATRARQSSTMARHLTGFDEEVKLGQLGEILENDSIVMSVDFTDENHKPMHPPGEPLFRGVALSQYEKGRWRRQLQRSLQTIVSLPFFLNAGPIKRAVIRQSIKLEPNDSATLFAMRPILELSATARLAPFLNPIDGTIFRPESRGGYDYEVLSDANSQAPQKNEILPSPEWIKTLVGMPEGLRSQLRKIALPLVQDLPHEGSEAVTARARALESYLRDSGQFGYTLEMNVIDPKLDPVEDFLVNRKKGHCEYFASALALLLRSVDIPARLINGFKGGDWNELIQSMNVRQKHAHSWVEAYVGRDPNGTPLWITLDATPVSDRDESVAQVGGVATNIRPLTDMIRYVWVFYILGYDASRQNRLLYQPIKITIREVRRGYSELWGWTKRAFAYLFKFQSIGSFISIKGFFVSFIVLSLLALIARVAVWVGKRLLRWWRGPTDDSAGLTAGILFYRRLAQMLADYDLERTPAETQNEFALRASRFLTGQAEQIQAVADVPQKIVEAFYRVRFGHRDLDPDTLKELEENLDLLQIRLKTDLER
jgi:transglutaminase-like putative cysteine protease